MRHYLEVIDQVKPLINDNESYIIFNDGKPVESNVGEGIDITLDDPYDFNSYGYTISDEEKRISKLANMTTLITVSKSCKLKIIHICDDVEYINYQLEIMPRCDVYVTNLYLHVVSKAHILFNTITHHLANLHYLEVNSFNDDSIKYTNHHLSHHAKASFRNLYVNQRKSENHNTVHLISLKDEVDLLDVVIQTNESEAIQNTNVYHHSEGSISNFLAYGIAKGASKIFFDNNGTIENGAHASILNQKTKGMILDEYSIIKALPALYIDEDDVSANHGASVGTINEDDLYYLMSRGLSKEDSEKLLINAFIEPFFKGLDEDNCTAFIRYIIQKLV